MKEIAKVKVVATAKGFFDANLREIGDVFEVPDGLIAKWFKPVDPKDAKKTKAKEQVWVDQLADAQDLA
jgi:hypothetical protein